MKKMCLPALSLLALLALNACNKEKAATASRPVSATSTAKETINQVLVNGTFCFNKVLNIDVTYIELVIADSKVTGTMDWLPYEKDSARGTLAGTRNAAGELVLVYNYMIEGYRQTETKVMRIENGHLHIKRSELLDAHNDGNLVYKDVNAASYTEVLAEIPCKAAS